MKRALAAALAACSVAAAAPALAQTKTVLRISTPAVPEDWHVKMLYVFRDELNKAAPGRFDVQVHHSGTLFRQGAEAVAMQRGNLEMALLSMQDIARQIPEYSIFTAGYLMRDPEPHAHGLHRGLPRPEDRHYRRPGQSPADAEVGEVLRGDAADRAHGTPRGRTAARDLREDLARAFGGAQGPDEESGGKGGEIQRRKPRARGKGAARIFSRARNRDHYAGRGSVQEGRPGGVPQVGVRGEVAARTARAHQCGQVEDRPRFPRKRGLSPVFSADGPI